MNYNTSLTGFLYFLSLFIPVHILAQQTVGLFQNDSLATNGYVLFGNNETTYLIDNCGFMVNTWESDFDPGQSMYLLENGHLLRTAEVEGDFAAGGAGGRFELFNWHGELLWFTHLANHTIHAHHDIEPLPNGNFLAIVWERIEESEAQQAGRIYEGDVWSEKIIEVEMIGSNQANVVWEWRLWDHLVQDTDTGKPDFGIISDHPELIDINYIGEGEETHGDWIHLNAIAYHETLDQIALSSRNFSEIWIIDHSTSTAEAASHTGGQHHKGGDLLYRYGNPQTYDRGTAEDQLFFHQHDIRWIPAGFPQAGKLMVFNNDAAENRSSIEIWMAPTDQNGFYQIAHSNPYGPESTDWQYTEEDFYSRNMSGAHALPNGNLFICEGRDGRFLEITPEKEIVWEYINPVNKNGSPAAQGATARFNEVFRATKYPADYAAFAGKDLVSGSSVEINPWESECDSAQVINATPAILSTFEVIGNPVDELLRIEAVFSGISAVLQCIDLQGRILKEVKVYNGLNEVDISLFGPGVYFLRFLKEGEEVVVRKIVKH